MLRRALMLMAFLAFFAALGQANAASSDNPFLARVVGHLYPQGESFACFSRQYDSAHLADHPGQNVTFAKVLVDARLEQSGLPGVPAKHVYQVSLAFNFRDRAETLTQVAECGDGKIKDSLRGGAFCAGPGKQDSHLGLDGNNLLIMSIPGGADLWAPGPIDQRHDTVPNPFGADDVAFQLVRADLKQCEDLAFDRQKPLRPHER